MIHQGTKYKSGCLYKARAGELLPATEARDTDYILTLLTEDQTLQVILPPTDRVMATGTDL